MMTHKILNRDPKDEILKAFRLFDDDETGKISFKNLKRVAKELGERMTDEELQEMIDEADRDGDGEVRGCGCAGEPACPGERGGVPAHHEEDEPLLSMRREESARGIGSTASATACQAAMSAADVC